MYKAAYLLDRTDIKELERIKYKFQVIKLTCPGQSLPDFHFQSIDELEEVVRRGVDVESKSYLIDK